MRSGAQADGLQFDPPVPFTYELFKTQARDRAHATLRAAVPTGARGAAEDQLRGMGKNPLPRRLRAIRRWAGPISGDILPSRPVLPESGQDACRRRREHRGRSFTTSPISTCRPIRRRANCPKGAGFAGLRIQEARDGTLDWHKNDWVAFLGAAYFRSIGELAQYGLSSRGVAIDVAVADRPEEFPDFTEFYIEPAVGDTITLYALMEGPSIVGAFRFLMTRAKGVVMDIQTTLFTRAQVSRFGIAPLTSMYWYSETKKETAIDWRPEVHDSDGLAMWSGSGERLWRPLNNPPRIMVSAFADNNPRGFGLLQRDRVFDHYLDGVFYDRRPSLWVEPLPGPSGEGWGKGSIQLCEIPTDDEIHDNVVAMWVPADPVPAGAELNLNYRLHWLADEPYPSKLAPVWATRLGRGGQPGLPRPKGVRKFMVEFLGGPLRDLPFGAKPELVVSASRGTFGPYQLIEAVPDGVAGHWRAQFDLAVDGTDPVELRAFLKSGGETLTETWMFQYHPF